jgi:L-lactate utilization protein LutB
MTRSLFATALFVGLALPGSFAARASADEHGRLHAALYEMRHARTELKEAKHDFGGHRAKALEALDEAIDQVDKALHAVGDTNRGYEPGKGIYKGYHDFPHVRHALQEVREARTELKDARHDYKGHREKAVAALDHAADQLEKAIKFAR